MKQVYMKRVVALLLSVMLLVSGLSGCSKPETSATSSGYLVTPMELTTVAQGTEGSFQFFKGETLYYEVVQYDETTGLESRSWHSMDMQTQNQQAVFQDVSGSDGWINGFAADNDGSFWYTRLSYTDEWDQETNMPITTSVLYHGGANGEEPIATDLTTVLQSNESPSKLFATNDNLFLLASRSTTDADGVMCNVWRVYVMDKSGALQCSLDYTGESDPSGFLCLSDGRVALIEDAVLPIDITAKTFGEPIEYSVSDEEASIALCESEGDYLFLALANNDVLYGYNATSGQYEKLLSWHERGIVWDGNCCVAMREDNSILAANVSEKYGVRMTPCAANDEVQKTKLTVAGVGIEDLYGEDVRYFNKRSTTCQMVLKDYAAGDVEIEEALTKLNTELLGGTIPDVLCFGNGVSYSVLAEKGLLENLYPFLDADETLGRDSFVDGVLAALETDGELYQIASSFALQTMVADSRVTGKDGRLNWSTYDSLLASNPEKKPFQFDLMKEQVMNSLLRIACVEHVDWEAGACALENDTVIRLLEIAKDVPTMDEAFGLLLSDEWVAASKMDELAEGKILFEMCTLQSVQDYQGYVTRLGENANFIGLPTENGSGTLLTMSGAFAITKACADKEGAWQFMRRYLLTSEGETGFSTNKADFEKELAAAKGESNDTSSLPLTEVDTQRLRELIRTAKPSVAFDSEIDAIIQSEASYYFNGKCTAQEAAANIQKRVSLYVSEQM